MKFGKNKHPIRKNKHLVIPIGIDGIGEERKLTEEELLTQKIISMVNNKKEELPEVKKERKDWKLYLNTIINLLTNNKKTRPKKQPKVWPFIIKCWRKDTTNDIKDLIKFISIHGALGSPALISILTITKVDIVLINYIRNSIWLMIIIYIIGSGSFYYLFLDCNKALKDTWKRKKR